MSDSPEKTVTLQTLPQLRRQTDAVAKMLKERLASYLETLRPLFAPERLFGKFASGKLEIPGADQAIVDLKARYKKFETPPYNFSTSFDPSWIALAGANLDLQPWTYTLGSASDPITMTTPVKWVVAFRSSMPLTELKTALAKKDTSRMDDIRQTVANALLLHYLIERLSGIAALLIDLRFTLASETVPELPGLPITTITSCLTSFCPPEDLVQQITAFSGVPSFIELIDSETLRQPRDPLREQIASLLTT